MKRFIILLCSSVKLSLPAETEQPHHPTSTNAVEITPVFVATSANEAQTNNPSLRAADARIEASRANEQSIRKWEDPMIRFGVSGAEKEMRADNGDLIYGIEQKLPWSGKPEAARNVAKAETLVVQAQAERSFQFLRKDIAKNVFRIGYAERVVEIGKQDLQWLEAIQEIIEQRYEIGDVSQVDVLRVQNERSKRAVQLKTDEGNLSHERVNLNKYLNRDLHSPWPNLRLPPVASPIIFKPALVEMALKAEPELKTRQAEIKAAQAMAEKTRRERRPDFSVGADLRNFSETGELREGMVTFSFNLPWGNRKKYEADLRREKANVKAREFEAADYALTVRDEIFHLTVQIDSARREALLYRDEILPRSESALESARIAWESNRGMFRDVLEARRMLLDAQLMYARAVTEQYDMMAELVLCCGLGDLEALQMIGAIPESENSEKK